MDYKDLATLKNAYQKQKELREFQEHLKENPMQISEARNLVSNINIDSNQKMNLMRGIDEMKQNGLVIDDIPIEFKEFKASAQAQGKYAITRQAWDRMTKETRQTYLEHSHPAIYEDKHLKPMSDTKLESHLQAVMEDLSVNKDNYQPFYPPKKETEN